MSIIVTGGSRGIGRAAAVALARFGEPIVITYRSGAEAAAETVAAVAAAGATCTALEADVTDEAACRRVAEAAQATGSPLRVLVNNAGITKDGLALRMKREQFEAVVDTNLTGPFLMSREALAAMVKQRDGVIVNLASVAGIYGNAGQANYSAAKAGLIGLTKTLAKEVGGRNIRVNAVAPGLIETDMTATLPDKVRSAAADKIPLKRFGDPAEVGALIAFLASPEAAYITGQVIEISGGLLL